MSRSLSVEEMEFEDMLAEDNRRRLLDCIEKWSSEGGVGSSVSKEGCFRFVRGASAITN